MRGIARNTMFVACLALLAAASTALGAGEGSSAPGASETVLYSFPPGDMVFPEGVGYHAGNGDFFAGSTSGGAVYRGNARDASRELTLFLPAGSDGRTDVRGVKVNPQGQLILAGGETGTMWMYDAVTGRLLTSFDNGLEGSFINDAAVAPDRSIYFTDSRIPWLYRVKPDADGVFRFEFWLDLRGSPIEYGPGFNLNGIVATPDGRYLIVVQTNTGKLFRVATDSGAIEEIMLAGGDRMTLGDGLLLDGDDLWVVRNSMNLIVRLRLADDYASGQQVGSFTDPAFALTTTIARADDRLLVVNSQFNRRASNNPQLPFTIASVPLR